MKARFRIFVIALLFMFLTTASAGVIVNFGNVESGEEIVIQTEEENRFLSQIEEAPNEFDKLIMALFMMNSYQYMWADDYDAIAGEELTIDDLSRLMNRMSFDGQIAEFSDGFQIIFSDNVRLDVYCHEKVIHRIDLVVKSIENAYGNDIKVTIIQKSGTVENEVPTENVEEEFVEPVEEIDLGQLPMDEDHNLIYSYPNSIIVNMGDSFSESNRSYYITGKVNGFVEGYSNDSQSSIRLDSNTTDFLVRPDEGTDSPFVYYYIAGNSKPVDELTAIVYETMSDMYSGYISELLDGEFGGRPCKYFTYLYDASHDEQPEETEGTDEIAEAATSELAEGAVAYFPASRNTTISIQTSVKVDNDPANFVDEQVMLDMIEKIVPTIEFFD